MKIRLPFAVLVIVLLVAAITFGAGSRRTNQNIERNETARIALCALRTDLDVRIVSSKQFLEENPKGIPGIPASLIRQGLANSIRTRKALSVLDC